VQDNNRAWFFYRVCTTKCWTSIDLQFNYTITQVINRDSWLQVYSDLFLYLRDETDDYFTRRNFV